MTLKQALRIRKTVINWASVQGWSNPDEIELLMDSDIENLNISIWFHHEYLLKVAADTDDEEVCITYYSTDGAYRTDLLHL